MRTHETPVCFPRYLLETGTRQAVLLNQVLTSLRNPHAVCPHTQGCLSTATSNFLKLLDLRTPCSPTIRVSIENWQAPFLVCTHQGVSLFSADIYLTCPYTSCQAFGTWSSQAERQAMKTIRMSDMVEIQDGAPGPTENQTCSMEVTDLPES